MQQAQIAIFGRIGSYRCDDADAQTRLDTSLDHIRIQSGHAFCFRLEDDRPSEICHWR